MKISKVQAQLNGEDILSIITEFIDVNGLTINSVVIDKDIYIEGNFKAGVSIDFKGILSLGGVKEGKVFLTLTKVKVMKLGFFKLIRSYALKKALKVLSINGIESSKDTIIVNIEKLLNPVPFIKLEIENAYIKDNFLCVEVQEVNISIKGELVKTEEKDEVVEISDEEKLLHNPIVKVNDAYTVGREILADKLPGQVRFARDIIFALPDIAALICRLMKDSRVPLKTKISVSASVAYIMLPTDIIPDKIPFIGKIDDVAVLLFALSRISKDVDIRIIAENWEGRDDLLLTLKSGLEYIINFTNVENVEKIYNLIDEVSTL